MIQFASHDRRMLSRSAPRELACEQPHQGGWMAGVAGKDGEVQGRRMGETQAKTRRVLVVDDDSNLIALISDGLELLGGYHVSVARDGASGLERFYEVRPDCVVVDVRMPGLNGFQFVRALRGDPETAQTPIVVLSAMAQDRDEAAGLLSGADAYLFKPARMADLVDALERAIQLTDEQRWRRRLDLSGTQPGE